jgi:hypothetical protein
LAGNSIAFRHGESAFGEVDPPLMPTTSTGNAWQWLQPALA